MKKLQLSFHSSFALRLSELARLLEVADGSAGLCRPLEVLMQDTGLGNKKVGPIKSWAQRAGLIDGDVVSPAGRLIRQEDPQLRSLETAWFMHFSLSYCGRALHPPPDDPADWGGWPYFVFVFRVRHLVFQEAELDHAASLVFDGRPDLLRANFAHVLRAYTSGEALARCQFLRRVTDGQYASGSPALPKPMLIAYCLAVLWERDFGVTESVLLDRLLGHPMGIAPVMGLSSGDLLSQLECLEALSVIELRRTVPPFQVVRRWSVPLDLLEAAYRHD